jgi:hypothetical protein
MIEVPPSLNCQADEASSALLDKFMSGGMSVEAFADAYVTARTR